MHYTELNEPRPFQFTLTRTDYLFRQIIEPTILDVDGVYEITYRMVHRARKRHPTEPLDPRQEHSYVRSGDTYRSWP